MRTLSIGRLTLEPLAERHAAIMFPLLSDSQIYEFLDYGPPPSEQYLSNLYRRLEARRSPDGTEQWLNWAILQDGDDPIGYVQATITGEGRSWIAYILASKYWGLGFGRLSTNLMLEYLVSEHGASQFLACVEKMNIRSIALLKSLGFEVATPAQAAKHRLTNSEVLLVRMAPWQHAA
jgi:RimJ/RimL family protein N-acetyltransferase